MRVFHITSPERAVSIVKSGTFYPLSTAPLNNDNGFNCFSNSRSYCNRQYFEAKGARLICEWSGPMTTTNQNTMPPLQIDVLHDQLPWRCFIRAGSNPQFLRVVDIFFDEGEINTLLHEPAWHRWLPCSIRKSLKRRAKLDFLRELREAYRNKLLFLKVTGEAPI
jgi:hypothetical protein